MAALALAPVSAAAAAETASPTIRIVSPYAGASYQRGRHVLARFRCSEGGVTRTILTCKGTVKSGHAIDTTSAGSMSFTVTATDTSGTTVQKTVHYTVWRYVNPLRAVAHLRPERIDMGVDYSGSGPIRAIGRAKIIFARANVSGPESCWGRTCAPPGSGMIVYRLLDGPFAGKYVYVVENITIAVEAGETVRAGQRIAVLHQGSPNLEIGWASGKGPETLAVRRGQQCACVDPGGWSSIEGRNFDALLVWLGAPSGYITSIPPNQSMPPGWPRLPPRRDRGRFTRAAAALASWPMFSRAPLR